MTLGRHQLRLGPSSRRAFGLLALVAAFYFVGRASGAGWVVVLMCALAATVVLGAVWPLITLCRVRVEVVDSPSDATAGSTVTVTVRVSRAGSGVRLRWRDGYMTSAWVAAVGTCRGDVMVTPCRRGVMIHTTAQVECAGPLGLAAWSRRVISALPRPMEVGPAPAPVTLQDVAGIGPSPAEALLSGSAGEDTLRGVRAYAAGDPLRIVHWPATARWGEVMVKELEELATQELVVVVDLRGEPERTEEAASYAAGLAGAGLRAGLPVSLLTAEEGGSRVGRVTSVVHVGRRLARAVATAPPPEPAGAGGTVIRVAAR
jgi:uncharacterized protein (DUF58 family)